MSEYINTLKAGVKDADKFENKFKDLQDSINKLDFNNFEDSIQQVEHNLSSLETSMDDAVKEMDENIEGQEEALKTMGATPEILKQVSESSTTCANAQDKYAAATENVNK
jgi:chromosome segregation ATPase